MEKASRATVIVLTLAAVVVVSCRSASPEPGATVVRPGAPGEASGTVDARGTVPARPGYSAADVRFMQGMIAHHAQAIVMTDMVAERTEREQIRLLARRIADSQNSEMDMMRSWLGSRAEPVAGAHAQHGEGAHMPGMLTEQELDRLRAATGADFDGLFLDFMIRHHEGALEMVADLFAAKGGQEPEIFQFASHVDADQRTEIQRMRRMLAALLQRGQE
jgi:uncharacterized protein (DUF305 family)